VPYLDYGISGRIILSNKRSKQARKRKKELQQERSRRQKELETAHSIVLRYSWRDKQKIIGELVYKPENVDIIEQKLKMQFGYTPNHALNHDFGEVLNRFKLKSPPLHTYTYGGRVFR